MIGDSKALPQVLCFDPAASRLKSELRPQSRGSLTQRSATHDLRAFVSALHAPLGELSSAVRSLAAILQGRLQQREYMPRAHLAELPQTVCELLRAR